MVLLQLSLLVAFFLNVQTNEVGCIKRRLIKTAAYLRVHDGPIVLSYRASTKDGTTIRVCNDESRIGIIGGGIAMIGASRAVWVAQSLKVLSQKVQFKN